jgi:hypothetical protein
MSKKKADALANRLGITIIENSSGLSYDVSMYAPIGRKFDGTGCKVSVLHWYRGGVDKADFWAALADEMQLVDMDQDEVEEALLDAGRDYSLDLKCCNNTDESKELLLQWARFLQMQFPNKVTAS